MLNRQHYDFAKQCGCTHLVVHLVDYFNRGNQENKNDQPIGDDSGWGFAGNPDRIWTVEELRKLKDEITRNAASSTYFARMQLGRLIEGALEESASRYVATVHEELKRVSVASRSNKVIGDRMIMNAAFLVRRDKENDFDAIVKRIGARHDKLTFKYTGPWPPYNFVNIRLKLERA